MVRVRLLPAAVLLLTVSAVAGCTTVSPARPSATTAPPAAVTLAPPPAAPLLADVRPGPGTTSATPAPHVRRTSAAPHRPAPAVPPPSRPARQRTTGAGAGLQGSGPCAMGRAYGHWPAGSSAATICQGVYGR